MAETTKDLVDRLKAHDPSAVADLSSSYGSKVYQLAFRYLKNREDAEEVAQDVLLKVYQKIDAFRGDSALSSWIYRITFNAAMSRLREFKQNLPAAPELAHDNDVARPITREVVDWSPLADEEVFRAEMRQTLVRALRGLAGALSHAGDSPGRAGPQHGGGQRDPSREGADAEVEAAPRAADAARAAVHLRRRTAAALTSKT